MSEVELAKDVQAVINKGKPVIIRNGLSDAELIAFLENTVVSLMSRSANSERPKLLREQAERVEEDLKVINDSLNEAVFPRIQDSTHHP